MKRVYDSFVSGLGVPACNIPSYQTWETVKCIEKKNNALDKSLSLHNFTNEPYKYQHFVPNILFYYFNILFPNCIFQDSMRIREWALRSLKQIRAPQVYYRFQLRISRPNFANLFFVPCGATSSVKKCFDSFTRTFSTVARQ